MQSSDDFILERGILVDVPVCENKFHICVNNNNNNNNNNYYTNNNNKNN